MQKRKKRIVSIENQSYLMKRTRGVRSTVAAKTSAAKIHAYAACSKLPTRDTHPPFQPLHPLEAWISKQSHISDFFSSFNAVFKS